MTVCVDTWSGVGMYLRTTRRRNRDGSVVEYLSLAHNHRVDGVVRAQVLCNLEGHRTTAAKHLPASTLVRS